MRKHTNAARVKSAWCNVASPKPVTNQLQDKHGRAEGLGEEGGEDSSLSLHMLSAALLKEVQQEWVGV